MTKKKNEGKAWSIEWISMVPRRCYVIFAMIIGILFIQSLSFDFTQYDDLGLVSSKELKLSNIRLIFEKGVFYFTGDIPPAKDTYYRPMQNVVYAIGNLIGNRKAWSHHMISIFLHFMIACLLFNFFLKTGFSNLVAFLTTVFFIVHPLLVQAVVWIPGLGELLITVFLLSSFLCLKKYLTHTFNLFFCLLSSLFFLLALLSKESAIGFVPVVLLYSLFVNKNKEKIFFKLAIYLIGMSGAVTAWYFLRQHAVGNYSAVTFSAVIESLGNNGKLVVYYIGKIFLPLQLGPLQVLEDAGVLTGAICLTLVLLALIVIKGNRNIARILFGITWYLAFLLPTLFLPDSSLEFYSYNHRVYLPFIGFIIVILEVVLNLTKQYPLKWIRPVVLIFFTGFFVISFSYSNAFKNKYLFFERAMENSPHSGKAIESLGNIYYAEKKCDLALALYQKAVELKPDVHGYYGLVANTYNSCLGDVPNAITWYQKAMAVDSTSKTAANSAISLGNIYYLVLKNETLAKKWFRKATELDPGITYPMELLGNMLFTSQPDSAKYWYERILKIDSLSSAAWNGMGLIHYNEKKYNDALVCFTRAMQNNASEIQILKNLMLTYHQLNDRKNTKQYAEEFKNLGGDVPDEIAHYLINAQ